MKRIVWIIVMLWAATTAAQMSSFRPLSKPEVSKLLSKARDGNTESQLRLGGAYQYGLGVDQDNKTAEYWLKIAAGRGDPDAETQLGLLYLQPGFETERAQAMRWFLRAAASGSGNAEHNLGLMYLLGIGVPANREQAVHWFRRGAQHGSKPARANLGVMLVNSPNPVEQREGFELLTAAAADGEPDAENALGYCYEFGAGTGKDAVKAVQWYKRAASHGNANAMSNLGDLYRTGTGAEQNLKEAFRWYSQGCDNGHRRACASLANAYLHGEGTPRDEATAYQLAMMAGVDHSSIEALERSLTAEARNRAAAEAERWKQAHAVQLSASPR